MRAIINWLRVHPLRQIGVGLFFLYWTLALTIPQQVLGELVNGIRFTIAFSVTMAYSPAAIRALKANTMTDSQQLVLGLTIAWGAVAAISLWSTLGRFMGFETSVVMSDTSGSLVFLVAFGGLLHLTAPGMVNERIAIGNLHWVLWSVATGLLLGGVLIGATFVFLIK